MNCHNGLSSFFNHGNDKLFSCLTISIGDIVVNSIVDESISPRTMNFRADISNFVSSALGIHRLLIEEFAFAIDHKVRQSLADDVSLSASDGSIESCLIFDNVNRDVWIKLLKFFEASLSSGNLANMFLFRVEV